MKYRTYYVRFGSVLYPARFMPLWEWASVLANIDAYDVREVTIE